MLLAEEVWLKKGGSFKNRNMPISSPKPQVQTEECLVRWMMADIVLYMRHRIATPNKRFWLIDALWVM